MMKMDPIELRIYEFEVLKIIVRLSRISGKRTFLCTQIVRAEKWRAIRTDNSKTHPRPMTKIMNYEL